MFLISYFFAGVDVLYVMTAGGYTFFGMYLYDIECKRALCLLFFSMSAPIVVLLMWVARWLGSLSVLNSVCLHHVSGLDAYDVKREIQCWYRISLW